jgi:hypothetical protein
MVLKDNARNQHSSATIPVETLLAQRRLRTLKEYKWQNTTQTRALNHICDDHCCFQHCLKWSPELGTLQKVWSKKLCEVHQTSEVF